jgi:hypothetical protein
MNSNIVNRVKKLEESLQGIKDNDIDIEMVIDINDEFDYIYSYFKIVDGERTEITSWEHSQILSQIIKSRDFTISVTFTENED